MAGTPAERQTDAAAGIATQESGQPQVEYRPFLEFTPEQLAALTGGEITSVIGDSRQIEYPTWNMFWNWSVLNEPGRLYERHSVATLYSLMGEWRNIEIELDQTVVVSKPDESGVAIFVNPHHPYPVDSGLPTEYDWIRVEDRGISIEKAVEGSPKVTDEIRQAARIAWGLQVQRETATKVA
ncbi:MAG: hypothetical protein HYW63_02440 [Candidatus Levybacteria bacterium]|nr:hypothetical protein [Candidatus Levybacteria bacterium]